MPRGAVAAAWRALLVDDAGLAQLGGEGGELPGGGSQCRGDGLGPRPQCGTQLVAGGAQLLGSTAGGAGG
ncbi:hypothetical protein ACQF36_41470 [Streptomyces sp. Marseille-Q5077]|uniref:hypothetical protein n=1 Tax=Streptomyces sp. Marseille-Q5077 TaxID=3418995 RepID=UPI003D08F2BC